MSTLELRTCPLSEITAEEFHKKHLNPAIPVLVQGVTEAQPWSNCASLHDYLTLSQDDEISLVPAEITEQKTFDMISGADYKTELTGGEAVKLLAERDKDPSLQKDTVLYAKIALNGCPKVLQRFKLETFLSNQTETQPVDHPMLLAPGKFFYWVFVGEKGTFSKTHVDVMCSDAWLVVISGLKEWMMVHPLDKHLVMDEEGNFANLFDIDRQRFPQAHRARMTRFLQRPGDAIFVPADAPHAVRNLEQSVSFTYNFLAPSGQQKWGRMVQRVMGKDEHDAPRTVCMDLLVYCTQMSERIMIRGYVDDIPRGRIPVNEMGLRRNLDAVQKAFGIYGTFLIPSLTNGIPIGYDLCQKDDRVVYYFEMLDGEAWTKLFHDSPFIVEKVEKDSKELVPTHAFLKCSSHFGPIPSFPPLSVLLKQTRSPQSFGMKSLASCVKEGMGSRLNRLRPGSVLHYSRFPFKAKSPSQWCGSYLFYSSGEFDGPLCLHPLHDDKTLLQTAPVESKDAATFLPHFEELYWNVDTLMTGQPLGIIDLQEDLIGEITKRVMLDPVLFPSLMDAAKQHGLDVTGDLLEGGLEKIMALVLWFHLTGGIVGFTYSHKFSTVNEPATLCLSGSAASELLLLPPSAEGEAPVKKSLTAHLTLFCGAVAGLEEMDAVLAEEERSQLLADVGTETLRYLVEVKKSDLSRDESEESRASLLRLQKLTQSLGLSSMDNEVD